MVTLRATEILMTASRYTTTGLREYNDIIVMREDVCTPNGLTFE